MKVAFLTSGLSGCDGWQRVSREIITRMPERGVVCEVLIPRGQQAILNTNDKIKVKSVLYPPLHHLRTRPGIIFNEIRKVKQALADCDLVHVLCEPYAACGFFASVFGNKKQRERLPFFITAHGTYAIWPWQKGKALWQYQYYLQRKAFRSASRILCVSDYTRRRVREYEPLFNLTVVPNGVNAQLYQYTCQQRVVNRPVVGSVGVIIDRKGYDISLRAIAALKSEIPDILYRIGGAVYDRNYNEKLHAMVREYELEDNVEFSGEIPDERLPQFYHSLDLFLLNSRNIGIKFEGFGIVHLEANAAGKPAIGSSDCGVEEVIENGYNGILVPQNDYRATAEALKSLLFHPEKMKRMGENGQRKVLKYSWDSVVDRIVTSYTQELAGDE